MKLFLGLLVISLNNLVALANQPATDQSSNRAEVQADSKESVAAKSDAVKETWQVVQVGAKQRVGWTRVTEMPVEKEGRALLRTTQEARFVLRRFGQQLAIRTYQETEETPEGDLLSFTHRIENPPAGTTEVTGVIQGTKLLLKTTTGGRTSQKEMKWDRSWKSPSYQDRVLETDPLKPDDTRILTIFMPDLQKAGQVTMKGLKHETMLDFASKSHDALKVEILHSLLPGVPTYAWLHRDGELVKSSTSMLGMTLEMFPVSREVAIESVPPADLDLALATLAKAKLPSGHKTRKATYRIEIPGESAAQFFESSDSQTVATAEDSAAVVQTRFIPVLPQATAGTAPAEYLASSTFLPTNDPAVIEHANRAAVGATTAGETAVLMEKYVHKTLTKKNFSVALAPAGEVARDLSGDCTEHAVLLAAMLKTRGIPARVVVGMVYVESLGAFGGHMWTEAKLGNEWLPLDATIGRGGAAAGHIRMRSLSLSDDGENPTAGFAPLVAAIGKMKIDVVSSD